MSLASVTVHSARALAKALWNAEDDHETTIAFWLISEGEVTFYDKNAPADELGIDLMHRHGLSSNSLAELIWTGLCSADQTDAALEVLPPNGTDVVCVVRIGSRG